MKKIIILGVCIFILSGCNSMTAKPEEVDQTKNIHNNSETKIITYSTQELPVTISEEKIAFDYTTKRLSDMAQECINKKTTDYFDNLVSEFKDTNKIIYNFKYTADSQESDTFKITLIPNKPGYNSLDEFREDFDQCYAGGDAYPTMLNSDWLLFVNSCGTGFDDGSGRPIGCDKIKEIIVPTLKFN